MSSTSEIGLSEIREAAVRIAPHIISTPFLQSAWLSDLAQAEVFVKWESLQLTGSFKLRGALNKMMLLKQRGSRDVLAASAGNHGLGTAHAARLLDMRASIVVPANAARTKVDAIRHCGAELIACGESYDEAESAGRAMAEERKVEFVSPYNDLELIVGQATAALEILEHYSIDILLVPVGGGGLLAGAALAARALGSSVSIIGVQAANSPAMYSSFRAGRLVEVKESPTCADGLSGNIEREAITFPIIRDYVSDIVLVEESNIERAVVEFLMQDHMVVEGSGAVCAAAFLEGKISAPNKKIGMIVTGRNIDLSRIEAILNNLRDLRG